MISSSWRLIRPETRAYLILEGWKLPVEVDWPISMMKLNYRGKMVGVTDRKYARLVVPILGESLEEVRATHIAIRDAIELVIEKRGKQLWSGKLYSIAPQLDDIMLARHYIFKGE